MVPHAVAIVVNMLCVPYGWFCFHFTKSVLHAFPIKLDVTLIVVSNTLFGESTYREFIEYL